MNRGPKDECSKVKKRAKADASGLSVGPDSEPG